MLFISSVESASTFLTVRPYLLMMMVDIIRSATKIKAEIVPQR